MLNSTSVPLANALPVVSKNVATYGCEALSILVTSLPDTVGLIKTVQLVLEALYWEFPLNAKLAT